MPNKGIDKHGDIAVCMVVGCAHKAIYKATYQHSVRGYCSEHKALATPPPSRRRADERHADWIEERPNAWRIVCADFERML
jgi:hypothetical protein